MVNIAGYFHFEKEQNARCVVSAVWVPRTSIGIFCANRCGAKRYKEETAQNTKKKLLNMVHCNEELELLTEDTCRCISFTVLEDEYVKDEIQEEERSSLQSRVPAVSVSSAGESSETLKLFQNDVERRILREFFGYNPKRKTGRYVDCIIMSICRLDARSATGIRCLVVRKKCGG